MQQVELATNESKFKIESLQKNVLSMEQMKYEHLQAMKNFKPGVDPQYSISLNSLKEVVMIDRHKTETQFDEVNKLINNLVL